MTTNFNVLIIGGGSGGISVAARLKRAKIENIAILEPSVTHYYQPLWTLVGGGLAPLSDSARPMSDVIPRGVTWIPKAATNIDPHNQIVTANDGSQIHYQRLVVAAGLQYDWDQTEGAAEALKTPIVSSNYERELAPKTWGMIQNMRSGTAVFSMPSGPIKCAGAPQKIAYLAADYWRQQGVLQDIRVVLVLPTPGMFGVPLFAKELEQVVADYGIEVRFSSEVTKVDSQAQNVTISSMDPDGPREEMHYDFLHLAPRQSAPDWLKKTELAVPDMPQGYVDVDKHTLQHNRFPNIFGVGDCTSTPNSKTGAAIRKQAPVVAKNVVASLKGSPLTGSYDGYASCPLTTARDKILITEFDYNLTPVQTIPFINTHKQVKDYGQFKRRLLPAMYWNAMLRGVA